MRTHIGKMLNIFPVMYRLKRIHRHQQAALYSSMQNGHTQSAKLKYFLTYTRNDKKEENEKERKAIEDNAVYIENW